MITRKKFDRMIKYFYDLRGPGKKNCNDHLTKFNSMINNAANIGDDRFEYPPGPRLSDLFFDEVMGNNEYFKSSIVEATIKFIIDNIGILD